MSNNMGAIFKERPQQWGLRGDPYLWDDLEKYFSNICTLLSEEEFCKEFYKAFERFTGAKIESKDYIYVTDYSHGGMSTGMISPEFWLNEALPLLIERFNSMKQGE